MKMRRLFAGVALAAMVAATAAAGEKSIKIGVLGDQAGPYSDVGGPGAVFAVQMAIQDFGGQVLGKPIEVISADMANKPDVAATIAQRWFDTQDVDLIVDVPVTSVALAVQTIARAKKKIVLHTAAASSILTGDQCSPYSVHWMDDTTSLSVGTAQAVVAAGGSRWYFLTPDYTFGTVMQKAAEETIAKAGAQAVGSVRFPLGTNDYSSFLLRASSTNANIFAMGTVGNDTVTAIKQASEFGLTQNNRKIVVFLMFLTEIHAIGTKAAAGLYVTDGFYWNENDATRAWSKRYFEKMKKMPTKSQANAYAAVTHYLKAVKAAGTDDSTKVRAKMSEMPADYFTKAATIRQNGRVVYDLTLYEVKSPAESKEPWDLLKPAKTLPGKDAFGATDPGPCMLK
jgi:branched-chain amino acid transport system substrate-binding protein